MCGVRSWHGGVTQWRAPASGGVQYVAQWSRARSRARRDVVEWRRDASQWSDTVAVVHTMGQRHNVVEIAVVS